MSLLFISGEGERNVIAGEKLFNSGKSVHDKMSFSCFTRSGDQYSVVLMSMKIRMC